MPWGLCGIARGQNNKLPEVKFLTFDSGILARLQAIFKTFVCEIAGQKERNSSQNKNGCINPDAVFMVGSKAVDFYTV